VLCAAGTKLHRETVGIVLVLRPDHRRANQAVVVDQELSTPRLILRELPSAIGHNTENAMRVGAWHGTIGLVRKVIDHIAAVQRFVRQSPCPDPTNGTAIVSFNKLCCMVLNVSQIVKMELKLILLVPVGPTRLFRIKLLQIVRNGV